MSVWKVSELNHQIKHYYWNWFTRPYPNGFNEMTGEEEVDDDLHTDLLLTDSSAAGCINLR